MLLISITSPKAVLEGLLQVRLLSIHSGVGTLRNTGEFNEKPLFMK